MKIWRWLWTVMLFLTNIVANAATVEGQLVFQSTGRPSAFVAVRLNSAERGPSAFVYSGSDGKFYLANVPPGVYELESVAG
jgi:Carboxypeptidase regulatory-like domain